MTKWIFSEAGEIVGPYELKESLEFVNKNPQCYAWQPEYDHWKPASSIAEFEQKITPPPPPRMTPELVELFSGKEKRLIEALECIDRYTESHLSSLPDVNKEIKQQSAITSELTSEVENTMLQVQQQIAELQKKLSGLAK